MNESTLAVDVADMVRVSIDGVAIIDAGEIVQANDALAEIHGIDTPARIIGQEWEDLYTVEGPERTAGELMELVRRDGEWRGRALGFRQDGDDVSVDLSLCETDDCLLCVVSERKDLAERLERYETIVEAVDDGVYILDEDLTVDTANERFFEMLSHFGISRDEARNTNVYDLIPRGEDRAALEEAIREAIESEPHTGSFEISAETLDGNTVVYESRFRLYPEPEAEYRGCIGILRDITDRQERERELREARQFNEELVEYAPFCMVRIDEEFRITYVNPRTEEVTGLPEGQESEALGIDIRELSSVAETGEAHRFTPLKEGETIEFEFPFKSLYGKEVYFTGRGVPLTSDGAFTGAVLMSVDISERRQYEKDLERQRDELDTLNRINELLLEVSRDLFESPMHGDIEETVCTRLAASDLYQFAWIGKPEAGGNRLVPDVYAGVDDGFIESMPITTDDEPTGQGPVGRAFRTGKIQVSQAIETDPTFEPWREAGLDHDVRSVAAVPLTYNDSTFGVLAVYASRPLAFSQREQRGFEILGEAIGYAINANKTRRLLFAEQVVELEFDLADAETFLFGTSDGLGCSISLDSYVATGDGTWLLYLTVSGDGADRFIDAAVEDDRVRTVRPIDEEGTGQLVGLTTESSLLDAITAVGGNLTAASIDAGHGQITVEVPQSTDVRAFVDQVRAIYRNAVLASQTNHERSVTVDTWLGEDRGPALTERQRQALEAAFRAGYFEWPRDSTAEEVADLLEIARPTLHAHLRKAEREVLSSYFDVTGSTTARRSGDPDE